jgi:hypothetical protein
MAVPQPGPLAAGPIQRPWAILLCRFQDDGNDPAHVTLSALYGQWVAKFGAQSVANWIAPAAAHDQRPILELYQEFFTPAGAGTFNSVTYWDTMSHGTIEVDGTRVFPCELDITSDGALNLGLQGSQYQGAMFEKAKSALQQQHGVDWQEFYGVAVSFQSPDYGDQGGWFNGGPGVFSDIRYVRSNGMESWGQEMGHAFGLDHSRREGSNVDYQDPWDTMSTANAYNWTPDPSYGLRGIGINAWNMRSRGWLDESRVWTPPARYGSSFCDSVTLRPLHRRDLPGHLAAELPGVGSDSPYLIEYRVPEAWDANIPDPVILVHRFEGQIGQFLGAHSYLEKALAQGEVWNKLGLGSVVAAQVKVEAINGPAETARIALCSYPPPFGGFEHKAPIPWWEWNPEKIRELFPHLSDAEFKRLTQRLDPAYARALLEAAGVTAPREEVVGVLAHRRRRGSARDQA